MNLSAMQILELSGPTKRQMLQVFRNCENMDMSDLIQAASKLGTCFEQEGITEHDYSMMVLLACSPSDKQNLWGLGMILGYARDQTISDRLNVAVYVCAKTQSAQHKAYERMKEQHPEEEIDVVVSELVSIYQGFINHITRAQRLISSI